MSSDPFASLVPEARAFLTKLESNNSRDWFQDNKAQYDTRLKNPALALLDVISADLGRMTAQPVTTKLFRPHRDVRFSKDKTPYHTHLHMLWTTPAGASAQGWYFGISPSYISIGAGVMGFDKTALLNWRAAVDQDATFATLVSDLTDKGARLSEPELKRVPAPYAKDHPRGDLLRHKGLSVWFDKSPQDIKKGGLTETIMTAFSDLLPVQSALRPLL